MEQSRKRTKQIIFIAAALILLIVSLASHQYTNSAANRLKGEVSDGTAINWFTDLPPALAKAKETGRPIFVDFYADWCAPCKQLDAETLSDPRVFAATTNWLMVKIDVDQNPALAQKYNTQILPTLIVLSPDGTELRRDIGFIPPTQMLALLRTSPAVATNSTSPTNAVLPLP